MDTVRIKCPNGHSLACPVGKLGQTAKCPKCNVKFTAEAPAESSPSTPAKEDSKVGLIHFLCPNGHELNGPQRLAGRAGQCPHCGERFQIPTLDELNAAASGGPEDDISLGEAAEGESPVQYEEPGQFAAPESYGEEGYQGYEEVPADEYGEAVEEGVEIVDDAPLHPMADVFTRLWEQRDSGVTLEIHLTGGICVRADRFAPRLSRGAHGVFGTKEENGKYTLNTIEWQSVQRVVMRNIDELPEEMFD